MKKKNKEIAKKQSILFFLVIITILFIIVGTKLGVCNKPEEKCGGEIKTGDIYAESNPSMSYVNALDPKTDSKSYNIISNFTGSSGNNVITYKCKPCYSPILTFTGAGSNPPITRYYTCDASSCNNKECFDVQTGKCKDGTCYPLCKENEKIEKKCLCGETLTDDENKYCCVEKHVVEDTKTYTISSTPCSAPSPSPSQTQPTPTQTQTPIPTQTQTQDMSCSKIDAGHSRFNPFGECKKFNCCSKDLKGVADYICSKENKCSPYVSGQDQATTDTSKEIFKDNSGNVYLNCNYDWDKQQGKVVSKGENYAKCIEGMKVGNAKTKAFCCILEDNACNADSNTENADSNGGIRICCPGLVCSDGKCVKEGEKEEKEEKKQGISCSFTLESKSGDTNYPVNNNVIEISFDNQESKKVNLYVEGESTSEVGFEGYKVSVDCGNGKNKEEAEIKNVISDNGKTKFKIGFNCEYNIENLENTKEKDIVVKVELQKENSEAITCSLLPIQEATDKIKLKLGKYALKIIINTKIVYSDIEYPLIIESKLKLDNDAIPIIPAVKNKNNEDVALECLGKKDCEFKVYNVKGEEIDDKIGDFVNIKGSDFDEKGVFNGKFSIKIVNPANLKIPIENVYLWGVYSGASYYSDTFTIDSCKKNNTQVSDPSKKEEELVKECCSHYMEDAKVADPNNPNQQKEVFRCYFTPKIGKRTDSQGKEEKFCEFNYEDADKSNDPEKNKNIQCTDDGICIKGSAEICNNNKDDNCDGLIDCEDPLCYAKQAPPWTLALKSKEFEYLDCVASIRFGYPGCGIAQCGEFAGKFLCKCWISEPAKEDIAKKTCALKPEKPQTENDCIKAGGFCIERQFLGTKILENGLKVDGSCDGTLGLASVNQKVKTPSNKEIEIPMNCGSCDVFCCKKNDAFKACGVVEGLHCCAYGCSNDLVCCNPPEKIDSVKVENENYKNYIKELLISEGKKEDEIKDEDIVKKEHELIQNYGVCKKSCDAKQAAIDLISRATQQQQQQGFSATVYGTLLDQTCFYTNIDDKGRIKEVFTDDKVSNDGNCPAIGSDKFKKVENLENNQKLLEQLKRVVEQSVDFLKTEYSKADNLLRNPTFEEKLSYWLSSKAEIDNENYKLTPSSAHINKDGYLAQYVITNLYPNDVLRLSGFVKGKDCKVNVVLGLVDVNGNFIKQKENNKEVEKKTSKEITGTDDFAEFKDVSITITDADLLKGGTRILVNFSANCEFWVDDLLLLRTKKGTYDNNGKQEQRYADYNELCGQSSNGVSCDSDKGLVCVLKDNVYRCDCKKDYKWDSSKGCVEISEEEKKAASNLIKNSGFEDVEDFTDLNNQNKKVPKDWVIVPKVPTVEASSDCKKSGSYGLKITYDSNQIMNSQVIQKVFIKEKGTYEISGYLTGKARIIIVEHGKDPTSGSYRIFEYTQEDDSKEFSKTFTVTEAQSNKEYDVVLWVWQDQNKKFACFDDLYLGLSSGFDVKSFEIKAEKTQEFDNKLSVKEENAQLLLNSPNDIFVSSEKVDDKNVDVVYIADTNNNRVAVVNDFANPKIKYLQFDRKPVQVVVDEKNLFVLLVDEKFDVSDYNSYIYVVNKETLSISKKLTIKKQLVGLAATKDFVVSAKLSNNDLSKPDYAVVFFRKEALINGNSADFTEVKNDKISIPIDVSTANYDKNGVFIINKDDDANKDIKKLVYVSNTNFIKELEDIKKPLVLHSLIKDDDYVVFVVADNGNNDKILVYNITSKEQITKINEIGMNYKIKSLSASDNFVYVLSGEKIYRYPYNVKENKASVETDKEEKLGSKGSLYDGVLALKSIAFTSNNVFFSVSDATLNNFAVLSFDNNFNPINYIKFDYTPLISLQNRLFIAVLNNISEYVSGNLKYSNSKKIDKEIKQYYYSNKHYFVVEEGESNKKNYCIYSLDNLEEKTTYSKINCLDEKIMSIYVESGVIYALTEKDNNNNWKIYSVTKDSKKEVCSGTIGYPRSLLYDSSNKVFWIGVSANPSKILVSNDCKNFIEYKFDKVYDTMYITKKDSNVYVLVSSKFNNEYKSMLYKLHLEKKN
ncbi:MAG: hypothetical protein ACP5H9_01475 [Candidatus Woesearchaeota archaeon]